MSIPKVESETSINTYSFHYSDQVNKLMQQPLFKFLRMMRSYVIFNLIFLFFIVVELTCLFIFFPFLFQSSILAFGLALVSLTFFSYFVLRIYLLEKKTEQFEEVQKEFVLASKEFMHYQDGDPEHHIALANACCRFADFLHCREYNFYPLPKWLNYLTPFFEKMSCWWHWQDVHQMKELLLQTCVEESIKLVKCEPTSLEVHASLANAYVMLSGLYVDPRKIDGYDDDRWIPADKFTDSFEAKFRRTAERAIEEFKILNDYAPNDPWVHAQLAYSYHDLQMPAEEIREYETLLQLNPDDQETLYRLGKLYFQQGMNAQGLRIYERLKRAHYKKAESLIRYYGAHNSS